MCIKLLKLNLYLTESRIHINQKSQLKQGDYHFEIKMYSKLNKGGNKERRMKYQNRFSTSFFVSK